MNTKVRLWPGGASEMAWLTVGAFLLLFGTVSATAQVPQIIIQPESQGTVPGTTVVFSVTAGGPGTLSYQWMTNSVNISGATVSSYTITNVTTNNTANYTVKVSNSYGAVTSQVASLIVYIAPSIITQPVSQTNNHGSNVTFTVFATGTTPLSYQWSFDGTNIAGATLDGYVINNTQPVDSGTYSVLVSNPAGSVNSTNATLLVRVAPSITNQPQSQSVIQGQTVIFTVGAAGTAPLAYQWRKNGGNLSLATNSTYGMTNVQSSQAATYTVVISNPAGSATSSNAVLVVNVPPSVTTQPQSQNIAVGNNVTFTVGVSGTAPFGYQWLTNAVPDATGTNSSYSLMNVGFANGGSYVVVVTNVAGSVTSSPAILVVGYAPVLTNQPQSQEIIQGQTAIFAAGATGTAPLNYQWFENGSALTGATNNSFVITNAQGADSGTYNVSVFNAFGGTSSTNAVLTVDTPPVITTQPASLNVSVGGNAAFTVAATGFSPLQYQWFNSNGGITNATNTTFTISGVALSNADSYYAVVCNSLGNATSLVAVLSVGFAPAITTNPVSQTNVVGGTIVFVGSVTGSAPIALQWLKDGVPIAGATNGALTITNLAPGQIGYYSLSATNPFGATVSSNAAMSLVGYDFSIWQGLVGYYPFNGNANDATGIGRNGIVEGAVLTNDRFGNQTNAYSFDGVSAEIVVNAGSGWPGGNSQRSVSLWFLMAQGDGNLFTMGDKVDSGLFCIEWPGPGGPVNFIGWENDYPFPLPSGTNWTQFMITYDGTNGIVYINGAEWTLFQKTLNTIAAAPLFIGADLDSLTRNAGFFGGTLDDVRVYNLALSSNEVAELYNLEADVPVITAQPQSQTVAEGGSATFSVAATDQYTLTYQWLMAGVPLTDATNSTLIVTNVQIDQIGYYSVAVSNQLTGVISDSAELDYTFSPSLGLVAYYPFNGNANDESGNGFNGTVDGATPTTDRFGVPGMAYYFNGTNNYILANVPSLPTGSAPRSASLWARAQPPSPLAGMQLVWWGCTNGGDCYGQSFCITCNGPLLGTGPYSWQGGGEGGGSGVDSGVAVDTNWHHVVVTYDGSTMAIYLDGVQRGADTTEISTPLSQLAIGASEEGQNGAIEEFFSGAINDVRIYNRALPSIDVTALYALEVPQPILETNDGHLGFVSGQFGFNIGGMSGETVVIQSSTNLQTWIPIQTNTLGGSPIYFSDPQSSTNGVRFYRVQLE